MTAFEAGAHPGQAKDSYLKAHEDAIAVEFAEELEHLSADDIQWLEFHLGRIAKDKLSAADEIQKNFGTGPVAAAAHGALDLIPAGPIVAHFATRYFKQRKLDGKLDELGSAEVLLEAVRKIKSKGARGEAAAA